MIRIGIAGLGLMGQMHAANFLSHPKADVVALADADEDRRHGRLPELKSNLDAWQGKEPLQLGDVRPYADVMKMCADPDLDAIAICLPSDLHAAPAIAAMEAGKHVFCEKPIALGVEEGQRMLDAAESNNRTLMVGHCLRFWPEYVEADRIIRSGKYGKALAASFARCSPRPAWSAAGDNWFSDPTRSGGVAVDLHIHDADIAVWWWGMPDSIQSSGAFLDEMPATIHSEWSYGDGPVVQFEGSWEAVSTTPFYFDFKVTLEQASLLYSSRSGKGLELATGDEIRPVHCAADNAYALQDHYFIDCLLDGRSPDRCHPSDSLDTLKCVTQAANQIAGPMK